MKKAIRVRRKILLTLSILLMGLLSSCSFLPTSNSKGSNATSSSSANTSSNAVVQSAPAVSSTTIAQALALQQDFVAVVKHVKSSVVLIETNNALGSGVVFDNNGDIVTNDHVVKGATSLQVTGSDNKVHPAKLVGEFTPDDLAVIHVDNLNLPAITIADSSTLLVGDFAIAIGNPLGLSSSVTEGIVSATGRTVSEGNGNVLSNAVQTSAAINPGNSGGALVDLSGDLIGIPTLAALDPQLSGTAPGIGFAIPSNTVKDIANQLIKYGKVVSSHKASLGIQAATLNGGGILITGLVTQGPAATAGLKVDDEIVGINGKTTPTLDDLNTVLASLQPGQKVQISVYHNDGSQGTYTVTLGELAG